MFFFGFFQVFGALDVAAQRKTLCYLTDSHNIKGLVYPKMKVLSVFTHPHVVPNLYVFICSAEHKGRYLE